MGHVGPPRHPHHCSWPDEQSGAPRVTRTLGSAPPCVGQGGTSRHQERRGWRAPCSGLAPSPKSSPEPAHAQTCPPPAEGGGGGHTERASGACCPLTLQLEDPIGLSKSRRAVQWNPELGTDSQWSPLTAVTRGPDSASLNNELTTSGELGHDPGQRGALREALWEL